MWWKKNCDRTEPRNVNDGIEKTRRHIKETGRAKKARKKESITVKPILSELGRNFYV